MTTNLITRPVAVRTLRILAAVLAVVTVYKFLAIAFAAGWKPEVLPWGFLVVISGPFVAATVLIRRFPRSGAAVLMLGSAVLVTICAGYLITNGLPEVSVSDLPLLVVGSPVGAVALVLAGRFLLTRAGRPRTA
jgi:hypothetical protein